MDVIECLRERGLLDAVTSPEELKEHLKQPRKIYCGFDPTADSLHVGNLVPIIVLRWFQKCGHTPIVILGGATGRIGDPSGKSVERPLLSNEQIEHNISCIRRHFDAVLDDPQLLNNDEWFSKFCLIDFLRDVGKQFRLGPMLSKDSVKNRLNSEEGISFTEFTYQILQAYDFYYLFKEHGVSLQLGGSDQWGNIIEGVDLVRRLSSSQAFGVTLPLLVRSDGKKFGKSEKGAIWLSADKCSEYEFYQYFIRIPDADVISMMRRLTFMDLAEIAKIEAEMGQADYVPNSAQKRLAQEVTRLIHGEEGLKKAEMVTASASPGAQVELTPEVLSTLSKELPSASVAMPEKVVDLFAASGIVPSKSEALRLIRNGGAYLNNTKITDEKAGVAASDLVGGKYLLLGSGKKKKMVVKIEGK